MSLSLIFLSLKSFATTVQYAYLSPGNLSNAFPFFAGVTDVGTFDSGALGYFSNPDEFQATKFTHELGCSNATGAVIQYERTVLCSMWVNEQWSKACLANYSEFLPCCTSEHSSRNVSSSRQSNLRFSASRFTPDTLPRDSLHIRAVIALDQSQFS